MTLYGLNGEFTRVPDAMSEFDRLKAQKDEILQVQAKELAKRIADECFGEATPSQIERIYRVLLTAPAGEQAQGCKCVCHEYPQHDNLQDALEALRWHQQKLAREQAAPGLRLPDAETLARMFHAQYELLAPKFNYQTRKESAVMWAEVPENNRRLMVAVAEQILLQLRAALTAPVKDARPRKMVGADALGTGNDHFGLHDENNFCAQRGCSPGTLREKLEANFDPTDPDRAQMLAYKALTLMRRAYSAVLDDDAGLRLGRDQKGDITSSIIEIATGLGLLEPWANAEQYKCFFDELSARPARATSE